MDKVINPRVWNTFAVLQYNLTFYWVTFSIYHMGVLVYGVVIATYDVHLSI